MKIEKEKVYVRASKQVRVWLGLREEGESPRWAPGPREQLVQSPVVGGSLVSVAGEQSEGCRVGMRLDCWDYGREVGVAPAPSCPPLSGDS